MYSLVTLIISYIR